MSKLLVQMHDRGSNFDTSILRVWVYVVLITLSIYQKTKTIHLLIVNNNSFIYYLRVLLYGARNHLLIRYQDVTSFFTTINNEKIKIYIVGIPPWWLNNFSFSLIDTFPFLFSEENCCTVRDTLKRKITKHENMNSCLRFSILPSSYFYITTLVHCQWISGFWCSLKCKLHYVAMFFINQHK